MKSLDELFHQDTLADIEKEISSQFSQLEKGYYDAKLAVMLGVIATESINALEGIDLQDFPAKLKEQSEKICNDYLSKVSGMRQHLEENAKLIRIIDATNTKYSDIEKQISQLLKEFDCIVKEKAEQRDAKPLCDL